MKNIKTLGFFLIGLISSTFLLDLYLQFAEINTLPFTKTDSKYGSLLVPNKKFLVFNEGFSMGRINSYGYFGTSYPKIRKSQTFRVVLIGDSYVEGIQLFERNHFRNILEKSLNETSSTVKYEVLNFGRSGFDLLNMYAYYKTFVKDFKPDKKFIFLSSGDLVEKSNKGNLPLPVIIENQIQIDSSFSINKNFTLIQEVNQFRRKSAIFDYLVRSYKVFKSNNYKSILFDKLAPRKALTDLESEHKKLKISSLTKKIIIELNREGAIFVVHTETSSNMYDYLMKEFKLFAKSNSIKFIDLSEFLKEIKEDRVSFNYWPVTNRKGHFNAIGHKAIAKILRNYLNISKDSDLNYKGK